MSATIRRLSTADAGFAGDLARLLAYAADVDAEVEASVAAILADVRERGDAAVLEYTRRFDGVAAATLAGLE
ncbi:MAG: histidinol dehydrogenase, partial [Caldimonas sp.]